MLVIVRYALQESTRRKVFVVVLLLTVAFLALYGLGARAVFAVVEDEATASEPVNLDEHDLAGSTLFGLSMFATLFLGTILAVFLTLAVVRGDAERGLLQPLVVRPLGRSALLVARLVAAAGVCALYVGGVYVTAMLITGWAGGWWPDRIVAPGLELALAVVVLACLSLLGSVFLSGTANGIAVFMVFGSGLVAGLLGQLGEALNSHTLTAAADTANWFLPFEALYQDALHRITADTQGFTAVALTLGPFGGAEVAKTRVLVWTAVYVVLACGAALVGFARRDL
ncbi:MAG: ABC transporter permease [Actinomycetota bacterium]|nr:ABC transporter permease [Actinomycetota bacterium]